MTARTPRLPGIGAHHSANPQSDEWFTPPEILRALPRFDLDPCASVSGPMPWANVDRWYTAENDGLSLPWEGHVWLNPPYSDAAVWLQRMAAHGDGIALVFARTDTAWWHEYVWPNASRILFLRGRVTFWHPIPDDDPEVCPSTGTLDEDECWYCTGEACALCPDLPRPDGTECDHDTAERHYGAEQRAMRSRAGHNSGGPSTLIAFGWWAAQALAECGLEGAHIHVAR